MKKRAKIIISGIIVYVLILILLVLFEGKSDQSSINSIKDAVWYSIVTLTTVGYGDLYPVTFGGKLLGMIFLLLSAGFFGLMISIFVAKITGLAIPKAILNKSKNKIWYIFPYHNMESAYLAKSIHESNPQALLIFNSDCKDDSQVNEILKENQCVSIKMQTDEIVSMHENKANKNICILGPNDFENYQEALFWVEQDVNVYCRTSFHADKSPVNLTVFDDYENCARHYWKTNPLRFNEKSIVIIGSGKYARSIVEQALLVNVIDDKHKLEYHIFGDNGALRNRYPALGLCFGINEKQNGKDTVYFHDDSWENARQTLIDADRTIICEDEDEENFYMYSELNRYYPVNGNVHVRLRQFKEGLSRDSKCYVFGEDKTLYTENMVLKRSLDKYAKILHGIYNRNNPNSVAWEELTDFFRRSNYAAADHLQNKVRILLGNEGITNIDGDTCQNAFKVFEGYDESNRELCRRIEHTRWMRYYVLNSWNYAPVRDNSKRRHNMLVKYEEMSLEEQRKDDYSWELLGEIK